MMTELERQWGKTIEASSKRYLDDSGDLRDALHGIGDQLEALNNALKHQPVVTANLMFGMRVYPRLRKAYKDLLDHMNDLYFWD